MTIAPTLEGGLRIDAEDLMDWQRLRMIAHDAKSGEGDLAAELGAATGAPAIVEDWQDYVVPDLREIFDEQVLEVANAIESAMLAAESGPGSIWITRGNADAWYGALNQARMAIEKLHHFCSREIPSVDEIPASTRFALVRMKDYEQIQGLLLDYVMQ